MMMHDVTAQMKVGGCGHVFHHHGVWGVVDDAFDVAGVQMELSIALLRTNGLLDAMLSTINQLSDIRSRVSLTRLRGR